MLQKNNFEIYRFELRDLYYDLW